MIRLQVLKLVFGRTEPDGRTDAGWTDGRGSRNSYLDSKVKMNISYVLKYCFDGALDVFGTNFCPFFLHFSQILRQCSENMSQTPHFIIYEVFEGSEWISRLI